MHNNIWVDIVNMGRIQRSVSGALCLQGRVLWDPAETFFYCFSLDPTALCLPPAFLLSAEDFSRKAWEVMWGWSGLPILYMLASNKASSVNERRTLLQTEELFPFSKHLCQIKPYVFALPGLSPAMQMTSKNGLGRQLLMGGNHLYLKMPLSFSIQS